MLSLHTIKFDQKFKKRQSDGMMNLAIEEHSHNSSRLEQMQVVFTWLRFGLNFHIHKRGIIPSSFEVFYSETEKWEELKQVLEGTYEWKPDDRIEITEANNLRVDECHYLLHINEGITIYKKDINRSVSIFFDSRSDQEIVKTLKKKLVAIRKKTSRFRIGYLMQIGMSLDVKFQEFKPYDEDLTRFMGDKMMSFRDAMLSNLKQDDKSGLYLLHGKPGTGKTSFIKSILSKVDKEVIYISPSQTDNLTSPQLIGLLMDHPNSILIIEDAETVLMKRQGDNSNAVSNLLNLTDGFPADYMNLNIICTFNTRINDIDPALLRKGRLRGIHQFKELTLQRARELADFLEVDIEINSPLSIAEICNADVTLDTMKEEEVGFVN